MNKLHYYFIGISGVGMSALAHCMLDLGYRVSGSDCEQSSYSKNLQKRGATIDYMQKGSLLKPGYCVVASSAIQESNQEIIIAKKLGLKIYSRQKLLDELSRSRICLGITGAHGKSTTSCLLAHTLESLGLNPSYLLGATSSSLKGHGRITSSKFLVCEADESDNSFLALNTDWGVVLNYDCDHLNFHKTEENLRSSYNTFLQKPKRGVIYCNEDPSLKSLKIGGYSYGFCQESFARAFGIRKNGLGLEFSAMIGKSRFDNIKLALMGEHNVLNALSVLVLCSNLSLDMNQVIASLATFTGVERRLEKKRVYFDALFYDDYAHHPNEIRATLKALRQNFEDRRITAIFEPHSLHRFSNCFDEFCQVFKDQSCVITDLFDTKKCPPMMMENFVKRVGGDCRYIARQQVKAFMQKFKSKKDLLVTLGAGNLVKVYDEF